MIQPVHEPEAVFGRLEQLRFVPLIALPNGELSVNVQARPGEAEISRGEATLRRVYGSPGHFEDDRSGAGGVIPSGRGKWSHPALALDAQLFSLYYLEAVAALGEQQLRTYGEMTARMQQSYRDPAERADMIRRMRELSGYYRRLIEIYDWLRTPPQAAARGYQNIATMILAQTGIRVPPPPGARSGRPNRVRGVQPPFSAGQSDRERAERIGRLLVDYNSLKDTLFGRHPLFVFLHENAASHGRFASLAFGRDDANDRQFSALIDHGLREIDSARNELARAIQSEDWANLSGMLDLTKASLFGEERSNTNSYHLARDIDRALQADSSAGIFAALIVAGIVISIASGGLAAPIVVAVEVALAATAEVVAIHDFLAAEEANLRRTSINRLSAVEHGVALATAEDDLDARLWMGLFFALFVPVAAGAGQVVLRRILLTRAAQRANALIQDAGEAAVPAVRAGSRTARRTERPRSGHPTQTQRATSRGAADSAVSASPETGSRARAGGIAGARTVQEASLPAQRLLLRERNGVRIHMTIGADGQLQLWRCAN